MEIYYDKAQNRLVYFRQDIDGFWDKRWTKSNIPAIYKSLSKYNLVVRITQKYLHPEDGPILEGGCGIGQFVYSLQSEGYKTIGVDTAQNTIKKIEKTNPELDVRVMDVEKLDFPDNYFAGYWSMGVIEHFYEGYDKVLDEMWRVVKKGGYIFVTVPTMCLLRRIKVFLNLYTDVIDFPKSDFYQFVLPREMIIRDFRNKGLKLIEKRNKGGIKGLGDEIKILKKPLSYISSIRHRNTLLKSAVKALDMILSPAAGHSCLFVFKKSIKS